jgi:hypothetical protein
LGCCSIANNPASRLPFQKVSRFELQQVIAVPVSIDLQAAMVQSEGTAFPDDVSTRIAIGSTTVLRL